MSHKSSIELHRGKIYIIHFFIRIYKNVFIEALFEIIELGVGLQINLANSRMKILSFRVAKPF